MRRSLWFVAGAGAGIYAMIRGRRAAEAFTADGLRDRMQALAVGARMFRDEVAQGKAEKESQLRERLHPGLDTPALVPRAGGSTTGDALVPRAGGSTTGDALVPRAGGSTTGDALVPRGRYSTNDTQLQEGQQ